MYDPFMGTATGFSPNAASAITQAANGKATAAYQQGMLQYQNDALAFQMAQQAYTDAMSMGSAYGYMPGGNLFSWPMGGQPSFTMPTPGTPTQAAISQQQTLSNQQLANQLAISQATGQYAAPVPSQYAPGTVLTANNGIPGMGNAYGIVQADGSLKMLSNEGLAQYAQQRGTTQQAMQQGAQNVDWNTLQQLSQGPPTGATQQTLAAQQQQYAQAAQSAGLTGVFNDPSQTVAAANQQGRLLSGETFSSLGQDDQNFWLQYNQNDPTRAAQAWASAVNNALVKSGYQIPNQNAPTLQMQQMYGTYGVPTQGQSTLAAQQQAYQQGLSTAQFGLSVQQQQQQAAQSYLGLLSQLQGPADYGQYLKVLGATPGGLQDLVGAAAGRYVPGGGTTGATPQAQTLQNLVGAATGFPGQAAPGGQQAAGGVITPQGGQVAGQYAGSGLSAPASWGQGPGLGQLGQSLQDAASGKAGSGYGSNAATAGTGQGGAAAPGGQNYQDFLATAQGLPAPSQIAPQSFNFMTPSQKQMMGSMYSNLGYAPMDINALYQQSLPKYAAGSAAGSFKLV